MSHGTKLSCPHCNATMTASKQLRAGKFIECPKCQKPFDVPKKNDDNQITAGNPQMGILASAKAKNKTTTSVLKSRPYSPPAVVMTPNISVLPNSNSSSDGSRKNAAVIAITIGAIMLIAGGLFALSFISTDSKPGSPTTVATKPPITKPKPKPPIENPLQPIAPKPKAPIIHPQEQIEVLPPPAPVIPIPPKKPAPKPLPPKPNPIKKAPPQQPVEVKAEPDPLMPPEMKIVRSTLPPAEQEKVNRAIDAGVTFLKKTQQPAGIWPELNRRPVHAIGYGALPGLTLLECGVEPDDPAIQRAAQFVRLNSSQLLKTYELALAILFLDRLGDLRDRPLIQSLALRLVAGQQSDGGWGYKCRVLSSQEMIGFHLALLKTRTVGPPFPDLLLKKYAGFRNTLTKGNTKIPNGLEKDPFQTIKKLIVKKDEDPGPRQTAEPKTTPVRLAVDYSKRLLALPYPNIPRQYVLSPQASQKLAALYFTSLDENAKPIAIARPAPVQQRIPDQMQDPRIKRMMALIFSTPPGRSRQKLLRQLEKMLVKGARGGRTDNSNSQFALLGLWAARRHGVPTAKALMDASIRYMATQNADSGWGYTTKGATRPAMTGVGLLGLAMGHGVAAEAKKINKQQARIKDLAIQKGLQKFAANIDMMRAPRLRAHHGLYFMWTVERVAVLYNLKTIGGKDWYKWGTEILLARQTAIGSWEMKGYAGANVITDTCFALLFLRRSNLVQDLTDNLQYYLTITESETKSQNNDEKGDARK